MSVVLEFDFEKADDFLMDIVPVKLPPPEDDE